MQGFSKWQSPDSTVQIGETSKITFNKPSHARDPICCNCACVSSEIHESCSNNLKYNIAHSMEQSPVYWAQNEEGPNPVLKAHILPTDNIETADTKISEFDPSPLYEEQYEKRSESGFENTQACEFIEIAEEGTYPPVLEKDPHWESAAAFATYENNFDDSAGDFYLQAFGIIRELEVEETMESRTQSTILFDPCENTNLELLANTEMQNRINSLEERILRLENEISKLEEINKNLKSRDIIPLHGSMAIEPCCGCTR